MKQIILLVFLFIILPLQAQFFNEQSLKIMKLYSLIEDKYVDTVNMNKMTDEMIIETLHKLDPHSKYFNKTEAKTANEQIDGNFEGVGLSYNILNDTIFIISVIPNGPSEKAGIKAGDKIIVIDKTPVANIKINSKQIMEKLRGKKGSTVSIEIKRRGEKNLIPFTIVRDKIPILSIDASYIIDKTIGYIKVSRFAATTMDEFSVILKKFKAQNIENIILDLTNNGGGLLDIAVKMADEFLDSAKLVVYMKGTHTNRKDYISTSKGSFEKGKIVVIIDENSASASEIFAGAIQDWDRGVIVGRRSFGKGLVQNPYSFSDGSFIRLTVARYYTPSGRLIQKTYSDGFTQYTHDLSTRYKNGEFSNKDSIHFADTLKYYTLIKKRIVFGGGGIMPDVFVPIDTTYQSAYYRSLISKNYFNNFILDYVDKNRDIIKKKYPTFQKYNEKYSVTDELLTSLTTYTTLQGLSLNKTEFLNSKNKIALLFKATLARDIWTNNEFYEIYNTQNPNFIKAIEEIKK